MANASRPTRYAPASPGDRLERQALSELSFLSTSYKAMCLNPAVNLQHLKDTLHKEFPKDMSKLDAAIMTRPKPATTRAAAPSATRASRSYAAPAGDDARELAERAEQRDEIARAMQVGAYAPDAARRTAFDSKTQIQTFGVGVAR